MRKSIYLIIVVVAMVVMSACKHDQPDNPLNADSIYLLGYTTNNGIPENNLSAGGPLKVKAAVRLSGDDVTAKATHIIGVRFYVDGCKSGTAFIGTELGAPEITKNFTYQEGGWQYVVFDQPYEVTSGHDYYLGYQSTVEVMGIERVAGHDADSYLDQGKGYKSFKASGFTGSVFCIQAICVGGDYSAEPQEGIAVDRIIFENNPKAGSVISITAGVRNTGIKTNTGTINVKATVGTDVFEATVTGLRNGETKPVSFTVPGIGADVNDIRIEATQENFTASDSAEINVIHTEDGFERNTILIEEFTSQLCGYCPDAGDVLHRSINGLADPSKATLVCHHPGGGFLDDFTTEGDVSLLSYFPISGYPSCAVDRMKKDGELCWHPGTSTSSMLQRLADIPANASLEMDVTYADETVTVTCSGNSYKKNSYITIMLCQDSIVGSQSGRGADYVHNNVVRAYLTSPLGDKLNVAEDGSYTYTVTYPMPSSITGKKGKAVATDPSNMFVVSAIHGAVGKNLGAVHNAARADLPE